MLLRLRNPWNSMWPELNRIQGELERAFGRMGLNELGKSSPATFPAVNVWEDNENLFVEAELPGFELNDLEIYVNGENHLSIKGERRQPEVEGASWHRRERGYGSFNRTIELSSDVDADKVSANLKAGVLTITLPKKEEIKPRRIEVKAD
jgi:HSP20 family protein